MAKEIANTNIVVVVLVMAGLLGYTLLVQAGNLEPSTPPAPTMKTLQEVYDAASGGINEREGFCQYFETPADSNQVLLTVPAGKRFVLLKLYTSNISSWPSGWTLTVNDNLFIDGDNIIKFVYQTGSANATIYRFMHDFPDRCVVVNANQVLKVVNDNGIPLKMTIIGYLYDVQ